jgi:hypothetical protein
VRYDIYVIRRLKVKVLLSYLLSVFLTYEVSPWIMFVCVYMSVCAVRNLASFTHVVIRYHHQL